MKIGVIIPSAIWFSPYVRIYTRLLDEWNVDYQLISWNRDGKDKPEGIQYNVKTSKKDGISAGLSDYLGYVSFIKRVVRDNKFDRLIVSGPQIACLLGPFLLKKFRGSYLLDYRDLSIEQKPVFKQMFALLTKYSYANVISSPGFKRCLPSRNYLLSHNFDANVVKNAIGYINPDGFGDNAILDVLTIGSIRDFSSNIEVVKSLANDTDFKMRFVGRGYAAPQLEDFCNKNGIKNIEFTGFYQKTEEETYVRSTTFMNIFYPRIITHDTALSNRFYNSLIYRKPMLVTKDTIQGDYAEKYNVGVAVTDCSNLTNDLKAFLQQDYKEYCKRCDSLLKVFLNDQREFVEAVKKFVK